MAAADVDARVHPMDRQSKAGHIASYEDEEEQILGAQRQRNSGDADLVHQAAIFNSSNIVMEPLADRRFVGRTTGSNEVVMAKKKKLPKIFNVDKDMSLHKISRRSGADGQRV